jgi:hypothetical protein
MRLVYVVAFVTILLSGCASVPAQNELWITINSDPQGARVTCNIGASGNGGTDHGFAPVVMSYKITDANRSAGKLNTTPCKMTWQSGATFQDFIVADLALGRRVEVTFKRPQNLPGLDHDLRVANELQSRKQSQDDAVTLGIINALGGAVSAYQQGKTQGLSGYNPSATRSVVCTYKREWISNLTKNCVFDCFGSEAVQTVSNVSYCPASIIR